MVEWKGLMEAIYLLLMLITCLATFFALYPSWGLEVASVVTVILLFLEAIFGYILFEKVLRLK
jgi:membrane protein implicated in regulation of membrane protease activity